jgi:glycosyltransferase involved in cell wall biosynthesis
MSIQAACEQLQVERAQRVLVTSRYCAGQVRNLYGVQRELAIVPELIDLAEWRQWLARNPAHADRFTVLFVGRLYRRKRVNVLLQAAAELRGRIPGLEVRIVGAGPCAGPLRKLWRHLKLEPTVTWLGDISRAELAAEYQRSTVFCLPSVQEGFGIVLLEAMAAGKPIVAARAAAIPEVAPHAVLADPDDAPALAAGIAALEQSREARAEQVRCGTQWVEQFDAVTVAGQFLRAVGAA